MPALIDKLVVIGVGLIGGSFALALKKANKVGRVVGVGRIGAGKSASLGLALELGIIDAIGGLDRATLHDASLVLLAMPVGQMVATMRAIAPHLGAHTVVTDACSTKQSVIAAARQELAASLPQFVPAHPIAGAELSGPAAAKADLFVNRRVVIARTVETSDAAAALVTTAWEACSAKISSMRGDVHDKVFAAVSHLPHLLAYALVHDLCERDNAETLFSFAASGFRDFTRIAGSDVSMWSDIFLDNRVALLAELDAYMAQLEALRAIIAAADVSRLEQLLKRAREARNAWAESQPPAVSPSTPDA